LVPRFALTAQKAPASEGGRYNGEGKVKINVKRTGLKTRRYNGLLGRVGQSYHATSAATVFARAVKFQSAAGLGDAPVDDR